MKKSWILLLLLWPVFGPLLHAQQDTVFNYSCDFEEENIRSQWTVMMGATATSLANQWAIGTAVNNGGSYGLYISADKGETASYVGSSNVLYAATTLILRNTGSDYILSFDWMANGDVEGGVDGLEVAWIPVKDYYGEPIVIESMSGSAISAAIKPYRLEVNPTAVSEEDRVMLRGKSTWQTVSVKIPASRTNAPYRLTFIWKNGTMVSTPGACIDNISIMDGRACEKPENLRISTTGGDSLHLNWDGEASQYEIGCYSYETTEWQLVRVMDTTTYTFTNVPEGFCDFYVRTVCWDTINEQEYFSGKSMTNKFIYFPDNHCIDYITLTDDNCYYTEKNAFSDTRDNITYIKGMVDMGSESKESRHTHHYSKTETDPRTGGKLKTVPTGEIASVRLGNWDIGAQSERAEFKFYVDTTVNPILIMKYAVVLENPGHDEGKTTKIDPRFKLEVMRKGKSIGECSSADFTSSQGGSGWNEYKPASGTVVVWRDWTTIGVNLGKYHGETLTIRVTTYDCGATGHYGYAYFTMGCDRAELNAETCDGVPITEFRAPSGFNYEWYSVDNPDVILSTDQYFRLTDSLDTHQYAVDVIFKEKEGCSFTLKTAIPRYPVAEFDYEIVPRDCKNYVRFTNKSRVQQNDYSHQQIIQSKADSVCWNMGKYTSLIDRKQFDLQEVEFPQEGDTFDVALSCHIGGCEDVMTKTIYLPAIGTTYADTIVDGCKGYPYTFEGTNYDGTPFIGHTYTASGVYQDTLRSSIGCDSITITHLTMHDTAFHLVEKVILDTQFVQFEDTILRTTGVYVRHHYTDLGCDSFNILDLYVHQALIIQMPARDSICAQSAIWEPSYTIQQGRFYRYSVEWEDPRFENVNEESPVNPIPLTIPTMAEPNYYPVYFIFHDSLASIYPETIHDDTVRVQLQLMYPSTIFTQRWNDILAIKNASYNGGYDFVDYQWYKNDVEITGDTLSYLYVAGGLDMSATYRARVTRQSDGVTLFTCPVSPEFVTGLQDMPTLLQNGSTLTLPGRGEARWYTPMGVCVVAEQYDDSAITVPSQAGILLLSLFESDSPITTYRMMIY